MTHLLVVEEFMYPVTLGTMFVGVIIVTKTNWPQQVKGQMMILCD